MHLTSRNHLNLLSFSSVTPVKLMALTSYCRDQQIQALRKNGVTIVTPETVLTIGLLGQPSRLDLTVDHHVKATMMVLATNISAATSAHGTWKPSAAA